MSRQELAELQRLQEDQRRIEATRRKNEERIQQLRRKCSPLDAPAADGASNLLHDNNFTLSSSPHDVRRHSNSTPRSAGMAVETGIANASLQYPVRDPPSNMHRHPAC